MIDHAAGGTRAAISNQVRARRKREKQIFSRLKLALRRRLDLRVKEQASTISQVFEDAIDYACEHREAFEAFLPSRFYRQPGVRSSRNLGLKPIATAVSPRHYAQFRSLCAPGKRYTGDIVDGMLSMYLTKQPAAKLAEENLRKWLSPLLNVEAAPEFPGAATSLSINAIEAGEFVLLDESVLLCAMLSLDSGSGDRVAEPVSSQAHNLLLRCCSLTSVGFITSNALVRFWKYLWELEFHSASPLLTEAGTRAPCEVQMEEVKCRAQHLTHSTLRVIDLDWKDIETALRFSEGTEIEWAASVACVLRQTQFRVSIATATDNYDRLALRSIALAVDELVTDDAKDRIVCRKITDIRRAPRWSSSPARRADVPCGSLFSEAELQGSPAQMLVTA